VKQISTFQITGMTLSRLQVLHGPMELSFGNPTIVTAATAKVNPASRTPSLLS
jgi:hypothetical protein